MAAKSTESMFQRSKDIIITSMISIAITIVFGYYFLYIGNRERKPTFYLDPTRTTILILRRVSPRTLRQTETGKQFFFSCQTKALPCRQVFRPDTLTTRWHTVSARLQRVLLRN